MQPDYSTRRRGLIFNLHLGRVLALGISLSVARAEAAEALGAGLLQPVLVEATELQARLPSLTKAYRTVGNQAVGDWSAVEATVAPAETVPGPVMACLSVLVHTAGEGLRLLEGRISRSASIEPGASWTPRLFMQRKVGAGGVALVVAIRIQLVAEERVVAERVQWRGAPQPWPTQLVPERNALVSVLCTPWAYAAETGEGVMVDAWREGLEVDPESAALAPELMTGSAPRSAETGTAP